MTASYSGKSNIVLIGFSTTGKSRAGWLLAQRLGWAFVDTDAWISGMARKSIPEIFAQEGERHFRELERQALDEALGRSRTVIATGGGAVIYESNRRLMAERGWVVLLEARPETILQRMQAEDAQSGVPIRPLLAGDDPFTRIIELKRERQALYDSLADCVIRTDDRTIEEIVDKLVERLAHLGEPGLERGDHCHEGATD